MSVGVQHPDDTAARRHYGVLLVAFGISLVLNVLLFVQLFWRTMTGGIALHFNGMVFSISILALLAVVVGRWVFLRHRTSETIREIAEAQAEGYAVESSARRDPTRHTPAS